MYKLIEVVKGMIEKGVSVEEIKKALAEMGATSEEISEILSQALGKPLEVITPKKEEKVEEVPNLEEVLASLRDIAPVLRAIETLNKKILETNKEILLRLAELKHLLETKS